MWKDQDYRSASVEDKVSNTISIIGIPKTATMEQVIIKQKSNFMCYQAVLVLVGMDSHGIPHSFWYYRLQILGAFAVRDGVPMQGMKIKNVVPGKN